MTYDVINSTGKKVSTITLPKEIFELEVDPQVIAQAIRVYQANQHQGSKKVLSRGEVNRTTAKVWKQKGTGRARHGARSAPIFVGGGVAHGFSPINSPKLTMSKKMKQAALLGSLSIQAKQKNLIILDNLSGFNTKTKTAQTILTTIAGYNSTPAAKITLIAENPSSETIRSTGNLPGFNLTRANRLSTYRILNSEKIIIVKDAIETIKSIYSPKA